MIKMGLGDGAKTKIKRVNEWKFKKRNVNFFEIF
jgi:hypothetical protein